MKLCTGTVALLKAGLIHFNISMSVATLASIIAGLYGLSGAGFFWRLPWLKNLIFIGGLYAIRGLQGLLPLPVVTNIGIPAMFHDGLFLFLFLVCGIVYLYNAHIITKVTISHKHD
jgi:uncharacterized membrane protein